VDNFSFAYVSHTIIFYKRSWQLSQIIGECTSQVMK
jgi:hypothetical protein